MALLTAMQRESLKMQEEDWQSLEGVAASCGALYSGKPSWRRLILRIARGEIVCKPVTKRKPPKAP